MPVSRFVVACALALGSSLFTSPAAPCSPACRVFQIPAGGTVPANMLGISFRHVGQRPGEWITVTEILAGVESALPVTVEYDEPSGMQFARFDRALVPGARYRVAIASNCEADGAYETSYFDAGPEAPLPSSLGTVQASEQVAVERDVWTNSGSCTAPADIRSREVSLDFSPDAEPWIAALNIAWWVGEYHAAGIEYGPDDWSRATAYRVCAADDPGVETGFREGTTPLFAVARLPGSDHVIAPATVDIAFECGDLAAEAEASEPDGAETGEPSSGGCSGASGDNALLLLLALAYVVRRSRNPIGGDTHEA